MKTAAPSTGTSPSPARRTSLPRASSRPAAGSRPRARPPRAPSGCQKRGVQSSKPRRPSRPRKARSRPAPRSPTIRTVGPTPGAKTDAAAPASRRSQTAGPAAPPGPGAWASRMVTTSSYQKLSCPSCQVRRAVARMRMTASVNPNVSDGRTRCRRRFGPCGCWRIDWNTWFMHITNRRSRPSVSMRNSTDQVQIDRIVRMS